ncbi:DMT family transporter [Cerasicoccus fimbriatus]|uniref:DMT family transporter n=1 Tax=Cerasicoccus fimbriatus TaxID=3014554 RepID=UPI0022B53745|nr:DMT family transporter [Cerasicoccus sp. TK19100]
MDWITLGLLSALVLGLYDLGKKHAVRENAVLPVLFWAQVCAACIWLPWVILSRVNPDLIPSELLRVDALDLPGHFRLFAKSALVGTSWIFAYFALKHLPISLVAPIRATSPVWTLLGAYFLLSERFNAMQWTGILITLGGFYLLSVAGKKEGIRFHRDRWVWFIIAATLLGAASSLYDKYLLNVLGYRTPTVQSWFAIYLVVFFFPFVWGWQRRWWPRGEFHWRWSIPFVGIALLVADFAYFRALEMEGVLIGVLSCLRRGSALVSFAGGLWLFKEKNGLRKLPALLTILVGIIVLVLGKGT